MKRIATVLSLSLLPFIAAAPAPSAAGFTPDKKVQKCTESRGVFKPNNYPQCWCDPAKNLFNIQQPGIGKDAATIRKQMQIANRAKERLDMCEPTDIRQTSSNIRKGKAPAAEPEAPANVAGQFSPSSISQEEGKQAVVRYIVTSGGKQLSSAIIGCDDGCDLGGVQGQRSMTQPFDGKSNTAEFPMTLTSTGKGHGKVTVTLLKKKGGSLPGTFAEVTWTPKPESPCKKSKGVDADNGHCYCPGPDMMESLTPPYVCIKKPPSPCKQSGGGDLAGGGCDCSKKPGMHTSATAPYVCEADKEPIKKVSPGTMVHPRIGMVGGVTKRTGNYIFAAAGLSIDILPNLDWFGEIGIGAPGATRHDSDGNPVILMSGNRDTRSYSGLLRSGFGVGITEQFGLAFGGLHKADGLAGFGNPVRTSTAGFVGPRVSLVGNGFTVRTSVDFTLGGTKEGSGATKLDPGCMVTAAFDLFDRKK